MELLIDAALPDLRVALAERGEVVASAIERGGRAESVEPLLRRVLESAKAELSDVRAVLVSRGPGSFTGLRIGTACVKGLAQPGEKKVYKVSSLDLIYECSRVY
ncbi:MAG: tRNA (adenosine(37)-N6)-threonylcarbamoyltransferase complex dimerization subunit type 1 TsaB, partial [Fibrobacterales bacterium]|nr:tRNA (adenosine(37)-N6)-threonylcarbamoyltransferase complex dimerization subunit type 1 TsaB [Fibrobacterales bacterium]